MCCFELLTLTVLLVWIQWNSPSCGWWWTAFLAFLLPHLCVHEFSHDVQQLRQARSACMTTSLPAVLLHSCCMLIQTRMRMSINSNVTAVRRSIRGTLLCDSSRGVQAFWLKLCTQSHILNSGSQKEFLVKTQEFGGRKLPDVSQVSSSARSSLSVRSKSVFTASAFT